MQDGRVSFEGTLRKRNEVLLAPASGTPCVHWRLKITEPIDARLQLVHEVTSPEGFDLLWSSQDLAMPDAGATHRPWLRLEPPSTDAVDEAIRIRVVSESMQLRATPVLHRPGSPGALRVAQQFGLSTAICVEEVALPEGARVQVAGFLDGGTDGIHSGPFRDVTSELELHEGALVVPERRELGPALLPWALGTAAALLGGVGATAWATWRFDLFDHVRNGAPVHLRPAPEMGPARHFRHHFSRPD